MLRIEDTDTERSKPEYEKEVRDSLDWLGFQSDGEAVRQSERLNIYKNYADQLVKIGFAYPSEGAVKFRAKREAKIYFEDLVHGPMEFDSAFFDDFVVMKSNGFPTYNFACVVDDHAFGMTHVIRGDDHLSNTPRQLLMYEALQWRPPLFGHLPLVLGRDGEPLSKRNGEVNLAYYKKEGFVPDGILNYLALLGWASGTNQEFFSFHELIQKFSFDNVHKTSATFDVEKLKWLNGEHLKALPDEEFVRCGKDYLKSEGKVPKGLSEETLSEMILLFKSRIRIWSDFVWQAGFFWEEKINYDAQALSQHIHGEKTRGHLAALEKKLNELADFSDAERIERALRASAEGLGVPAKELIHPTRIALTGRSVSPSLFLVMKLMGKELALKRIRLLVERLS